MIHRLRKAGPKLTAIRALEEKRRQQERETEMPSEHEQKRIDEARAILVHPQPKSNGRVDGIEI